MAARDVLLTESSPVDTTLASLIASEKARLLTPDDQRVLGTSSKALPLDQAVLFLAASVRRQTGADIILLSHKTFGDGLPDGPITAYDSTSFLRFDRGFCVAELDTATLRDEVLRRCNQFDGSTPYGHRTGDYLYATALPSHGTRCRVVINAYPVSSEDNRRAFLGGYPGISPVEGLTLSGALAEALRT